MTTLGAAHLKKGKALYLKLIHVSALFVTCWQLHPVEVDVVSVYEPGEKEAQRALIITLVLFKIS